eukprot:scaffold9553_cov114-Isochrysis_galbana.AAC.17
MGRQSSHALTTPLHLAPPQHHRSPELHPSLARRLQRLAPAALAPQLARCLPPSRERVSLPFRFLKERPQRPAPSPRPPAQVLVRTPTVPTPARRQAWVSQGALVLHPAPRWPPPKLTTPRELSCGTRSASACSLSAGASPSRVASAPPLFAPAPPPRPSPPSPPPSASCAPDTQVVLRASPCAASPAARPSPSPSLFAPPPLSACAPRRAAAASPWLALPTSGSAKAAPTASA